ncbi:hypothetical protein D3C76_1293040 [compost metagenome]
MGDNRLGFVTAHVLQQAGTDRNQRRVATRAGGEGVNVRCVIDRDLRHSNTRLAGLVGNGGHQPLFHVVTRLLNNLAAHGLERHPLGHQQRDKGATKTKQQRHD